jgi:predicted metal-dependent hydrolase
MDHSTAFWKEVSRHYKDYKKARKELNSWLNQ